MAQKVVGYREMIWTCPNCGAKNPGSTRVCRSCGAAMGEDVKFEQQTNAGMITDEAVIQKASQGPDIYCAYCGNRNPAGSKTCSRCGADLSEGSEREHGTQHSAHLEEHDHSADPVVCPNCGTENPAGSLKCRTCGSPLNISTQKEEIPADQENNGKKGGLGRGCIVIIIVLVLVGMLSGLFLNSCGTLGISNSTPVPNTVIDAVVTAQNWRTSVQVIGPVETRASAWEENVPSEARNVRCEDRKRYTSDEEEPNSVEVCGTPYAVDMGNGYEQFVQDCVYDVYDSYCEYTITKTGVIETRTASGSGPNPELPYVESVYSMGSQGASYSIILRDSNGREYTLNPDTINEYRSYSVGTEYQIEVNSRGRIVNMEKK